MRREATYQGSRIPLQVFAIAGIILALAGLLLSAGCSAPAETETHGDTAMTLSLPEPVTRSITDSAGTVITLDKPAERIVVVNGNAAELLFAIGAGDRIVGVSEAVRTNPTLSGRLTDTPSIGDWQSPSIEEILALHPDLVIAYASSRPKNIDQIVKTGVTIAAIDCYRLDTLASDARALGVLTGTDERAAEYITFLNRTTDTVRDRISTVPSEQRPRVYFESYSDYAGQGPGTGSDTLLTLAGGRNILSLLPSGSVKVSAEWIIAEDPDVFLKVLSPVIFRERGMEMREKILARPGMEEVTAVRNGKFYILINDITYGPRSFAGLVTLAKIFYPDRFADLSPAALVREYEEEFFPGSDPGQYTIPPL